MEVELVSYSQPVKKDADKNPLSIAELAASVCYDARQPGTPRYWNTSALRSMLPVSVGHFWHS